MIPMRGIYITANDRFLNLSIALLNSIRHYDPDIPVTLIPYDDKAQEVAEYLGEHYHVKLYSDLEQIQRISDQALKIFGDSFFARPNQFRKQVCWFGDYDEFLYIDTDIVVFDKIIAQLDALDQHDFLCLDYQHCGGIKNVFTPDIFEDGVLSDEDIKGIFNGGWWAGKKGLFDEQDLYDIFAECAAHPNYFDFTQKTSDQPIINYMILTRLKPERRFNLVNQPGGAPGSWAGSSQFLPTGDAALIDPNHSNKRLHYLHWAGIRIVPGCPYWDIWKHYRYLNSPVVPPDSALVPKVSFGQRTRQWLKKLRS